VSNNSVAMERRRMKDEHDGMVSAGGRVEMRSWRFTLSF